MGSLLHFAARLGHISIVKLLVGSGADVNSYWKGCGTPVTAACRGGHSDVVEYLISKGATAERNQTDTGPTPLSWMIMFDEDELEPMINLLVDNGGNINAFPTEVVEIREH
ncbi:ankyrin repeat-containing domain protein, partial [Leptodontidium sp. 2 PMI_412]